MNLQHFIASGKMKLGDPFVKYASNNSGGDWWLEDKDWYALEKAGWLVAWIKDDQGPMFKGGDGRWLGALAKCAYFPGASVKAAIKSFESVTQQNSRSLGCNCCGAPHSFQSGKVVVEKNRPGDYYYVDYSGDSYSPEPAEYAMDYEGD